MVSVQYMSDLHLERIKYDYTITRAAPILILAGDIGLFRDYDLYRNFLAKQCDTFEVVLLVAGNHEFYRFSRAEGLAAADCLTKEPSMHGKLHFLNRSRFDLPNSKTTVLGCTLHSHIAPDYTRLTNDFQCITGWTVKEHNSEHAKDLAWLEDSLATLKSEQTRDVVIVTHYAPMFDDVCHPKNANNALNQCFSSHALHDVQEAGLMKAGTHWIFGHTHWNVRLKRGNALVLSNQLCGDEKGLSWWQRKRLYRQFDSKAVVAF